MSRIPQHRSSLTDQSGVVLLEWALVAGGLLLGTLLMRDTLAALNDFMILSQLAHEGSRIIARIPELEPGTFLDADRSATTTELRDCELATATSAPCGHIAAQGRIRSIIPFAGLNLSTTDVSMTTNYQPNTVAAAIEDDSVQTIVSGTFRGLLVPYLPIRATSQAGYLFERIP